MNEKETAALVEAMKLAQRNYCANEIGGLRNPNLATEAMQAALAVAQKAVRDDVLEEAAVGLDRISDRYRDKNAFDRHQQYEHQAIIEVVGDEAMRLRAMKEPPNTCKKCGGTMKPSKAIAQTYTGGMKDFESDLGPTTFSAGGSGKLVNCLKCEACGWSVNNE